MRPSYLIIVTMISLEHVMKSYGGAPVVSDLSLSIKKGSVFGFLGPNGAGKTTTIKMMVGLAVPDTGSITIEGQSPREHAVRARVGFMPETPYCYDYLSGFEFLKFCGDLFPASSKTPARDKTFYENILSLVGVLDAKDRMIRTYSKGMKQRLGFAQTLVNNPEYMFLDEPLDGLDPIGRREIKHIIKRLQKEGKTIFFNSHILFDTEELCDHIGIIHKGILLFVGPLAQFLQGKSLEEQFVATIQTWEKNHPHKKTHA